jgi:tellurite methyltransferase
MNNEKKWQEYYEITKNLPPSELLVEALKYTRNHNQALDMGAGALKDTRYLLELGFNVTAIDRSDLIKEQARLIDSVKLKIHVTSFEEFDFPISEYDIVSAMFSLPFIHPLHFNNIMNKIKKSLKNEGILCGQLFGINDEWAKDPKMTFHTTEEAKNLFSDYNVISFKEVEGNGKTANGTPKHWHIFHFIVRK